MNPSDASLQTKGQDSDQTSAATQKKVFIETFGCQMNHLDSELVETQLQQSGFSLTTTDKDADVVLYNTCSVRALSEQKVLSRLGRMAKAKASGRDIVVGVMGCMAERVGADFQKKHPEVDVMIGPSEIDKVAGLLSQNGERLSALSNHKDRRIKQAEERAIELDAFDRGRLVGESTTGAQAYIRITRGCNKFCAFCVVPFTRGEEVHRSPEGIIDEAKKLQAAGVKEITLLGQTINHYKHGDTSFADLLRRVHDAVPDVPRIRFLTSYPRDFTDDMLDAMADLDRMCPFLHIPAQSGSSRVLKKMNRGYTRESYLELIKRARERIPNLSIVGDMIVGFPTETDEEFQESLTLLDEVKFKQVYVFKYSPRPGTVSGKRDPDDISDQIKKERNNMMLRHQQKISLAQHEALVGNTYDVLVERIAKNQGLDGESPNSPYPKEGDATSLTPGLVQIGGDKKPAAASNGTVRLSARTRGDHIVIFDGYESDIGQIVQVKVTEARALSTSGVRVTE